MDVIFSCTGKIKDDNNKIVGYNLINISTGESIRVYSGQLKQLMMKKEININNLKLTSDNRIIDVSSKDTIIEKYIESCKLLGIKPLNIECIKGKYIATSIPKDTTIIIPQFVNAISVSGQLTSSSDTTTKLNIVDHSSSILNKVANCCDNTNKIIKQVNQLEHKINEIDRSLDKKLNASDARKIQQGLIAISSKIDNMSSGMTALTSYVNNLSIDDINRNRECTALVDNISTHLLDLPSEKLYGMNRILDSSNIEAGDRMLSVINPLMNKEKYLNPKSKNDINDVIPYEQTHILVPYISYAANSYEQMYNEMLLTLDISDEVNPESTKKGINNVLGWSNYLMSALLLYLVFTPVGTTIATMDAASKVALAVAGTEVGKTVISEIGPLTFDSIDYGKVHRDKKDVRKYLKKLNNDFPEMMEAFNSLDKYLDKEIFIFAIESLILNCVDTMTEIDKKGIYHKTIIKTLQRLNALKAVEYNKIELRVKASYLAACIYVNEHCKFTNDFPLEEVYHTIAMTNTFKFSRKNNSKILNKLNDREKQIYNRQRFYYGFVVKYFELALYNTNIHETLVHKIIDIFYEEAQGVELTPIHIKKEDFAHPNRLDMSRVTILHDGVLDYEC